MRRLLLIPLALLVLLGVSMLWSGSAAERPADFTFINRGEIGTLDPNRMSWLQDIRVGYALWEGLYSMDPQTLAAIPGCADRIDVSDDKTVYTFHLRDAARWSNGQPVTSGDFVFAWRRMLEQPGDYTYLFHYIRGAKDYQEAFAGKRQADFTTVGIEPLNDKILRVTLSHPVTFFPDLCAFAPFFPLYKPTMIEIDAQTQQPSVRRDWTRPPHLVGNGPYRLARWDYKRRIRLIASDYYWDRGSVKSDVIDMLSVDDPFAAFLKYDTGTVDWLADVVGEIAAEMREKKRSDLRVFPGFGTYFYSINCNEKFANRGRNPFADGRVRQAFAMAIDKRFIVEQITRMGEKTAENYIPPGIFPRYHSPKGLAYEPARAQELLSAAGYPRGGGFPKIELIYNNEGQHPKIAEYVRKQWKDHLNVEVDLAGGEVKVFRQRLHNKEYAIARASWFGDYNDPSTFTDKYRSISENNDSAWKNPRYDELCAAAGVEPDADKRLRLLEEAEGILCQDAPIIPLFYYVNVYLFRDNVTGIPLDPRNMVMFKAVQARGTPMPRAPTEPRSGGKQ